MGRNDSVGASSVAALFGCSPWQSEFSLFAKTVGLAPEQEDTGRLSSGRYLEQAILAEWKKRYDIGNGPDDNYATWMAWNDKSVAHKAYPFITATPDAIGAQPRWVDGATVDGVSDIIVVDVKTVTRERRADWNDGVPDYYRLQSQQQQLVCGAQRGLIIAQFGFEELAHEWIDADEKIQDQICSRIITFWKRVQGELPPPEADGHRATTEALARREVTAKAIELGPDIRALSDDLAGIERLQREFAAEQQRLRNKIRSAMGDASVGVFPDSSGWKIRQQVASEFMVKKKAHTVMARINSKEAVGDEDAT